MKYDMILFSFQYNTILIGAKNCKSLKRLLLPSCGFNFLWHYCQLSLVFNHTKTSDVSSNISLTLWGWWIQHWNAVKMKISIYIHKMPFMTSLNAYILVIPGQRISHKRTLFWVGRKTFILQIFKYQLHCDGLKFGQSWNKPISPNFGLRNPNIPFVKTKNTGRQRIAKIKK